MSNDKDLNLLTVFREVWLERNITRVADKLSLTQPAVSHSLKKLREQFDDPLFVRGSNGVVPTDLAKSLAPKIIKTLSNIDEIYLKNKKFSLEDERRNIKIAVGDHFAMTLFSQFQSKVSQKAPNVNVIAKTLTEIFPTEDVEHGRTDLVLSGFFATAKAPNGFYKKKVFEEPFDCVCRKGHPLTKKEKKFSAYLKAEHLYISPIGDLKGFIDIDLAKHKKVRNVTRVLPGFPEAGPTLTDSDLVLTAPRGLCNSLAKSYPLQTYELPLAIRTYRACLLWHERTHMDPFYKWARNVIFELFEQHQHSTKK